MCSQLEASEEEGISDFSLNSPIFYHLSKYPKLSAKSAKNSKRRKETKFSGDALQNIEIRKKKTWEGDF